MISGYSFLHLISSLGSECLLHFYIFDWWSTNTIVQHNVEDDKKKPETGNLEEKCCFQSNGWRRKKKLDPVGSTVCYEMMKLCTGSVEDTMRR